MFCEISKKMKFFCVASSNLLRTFCCANNMAECLKTYNKSIRRKASAHFIAPFFSFTNFPALSHDNDNLSVVAVCMCVCVCSKRKLFFVCHSAFPCKTQAFEGIRSLSTPSECAVWHTQHQTIHHHLKVLF